MAQPTARAHRNLHEPADISARAVKAALRRITVADTDVGAAARFVYETLTGDVGPAALSQSRVQFWLWYELPRTYSFGDIQYEDMGDLADVAARLLQELGLHRYAAICRNEATATVHRAFRQSEKKGLAAQSTAMRDSGIEPPDLDDFTWGRLMGPEEADAYLAVENALEAAIAADRLTVGARGWRAAQKRAAAAALDSAHPVQPGQSWRTLVTTERLGQWIAQGEMRSEALGTLRAQVANRLLAPIEPPPGFEASMKLPMWLLGQMGDAQPLTRAGNLRTAFVRDMHEDCPWWDSNPPPGWELRHVEAGDVILSTMRYWLGRAHALRKQHNTLQ